MFKENSKAIYLQIVDKVIDDILTETLRPGDRILSIRDHAAEVQVNPNTMMRAYEYMSQREIIFNKRGIGYFIGANAKDIVTLIRKEELLGSELEDLFQQLNTLGITPDELKNKYDKYLTSQK